MIIETLLAKKNLEIEDFFIAFSSDYFPFEELIPYLEEISGRGILVDFNDYIPDQKSVVIDGLDKLKVIPEEYFLKERALDDFLTPLLAKCSSALYKTWLERRLPPEFLSKGPEISPEVSHVVDFFHSAYAKELNIDESLLSMDYASVVNKSLQWNRHMLKNTKLRPDDLDNIKIVYVSGSYTFYQLQSIQSLDRESDVMGHCVGKGSYDEEVITKSTKIYSLRSANGESHATIELRLGFIKQIRGRGNECVLPKYTEAIKEFITDYLSIPLTNLSSTDLKMIGLKGIYIFDNYSFIYPNHLSDISPATLNEIRKVYSLDETQQILLKTNPDWPEHSVLNFFNSFKHHGIDYPHFHLVKRLNHILGEFKDLYAQIGLLIELGTDAQIKENIHAYLKNPLHQELRKERIKARQSLKDYYSFLLNLYYLIDARSSTSEIFLFNLLQADCPAPQVKSLPDLASNYAFKNLREECQLLETLLEEQPILAFRELENKTRSSRLSPVDDCEECSNEEYFTEQEKLLSDINSEINGLDGAEVETVLTRLTDIVGSVSEQLDTINDLVNSFVKLSILGVHKNLDTASFIKNTIEENLTVSKTIEIFSEKEQIAISRYLKNLKDLDNKDFKKANSQIKTIADLKESWDDISSDSCSECSGGRRIDSNKDSLNFPTDPDFSFDDSVVDRVLDLKKSLVKFFKDLDAELEDIFLDLSSTYEDF